VPIDLVHSPQREKKELLWPCCRCQQPFARLWPIAKLVRHTDHNVFLHSQFATEFRLTRDQPGLLSQLRPKVATQFNQACIQVCAEAGLRCEKKLLPVLNSCEQLQVNFSCTACVGSMGRDQPAFEVFLLLPVTNVVLVCQMPHSYCTM
jgi:hypothetical protein